MLGVLSFAHVAAVTQPDHAADVEPNWTISGLSFEGGFCRLLMLSHTPENIFSIFKACERMTEHLAPPRFYFKTLERNPSIVLNKKEERCCVSTVFNDRDS